MLKVIHAARFLFAVTGLFFTCSISSSLFTIKHFFFGVLSRLIEEVLPGWSAVQSNPVTWLQEKAEEFTCLVDPAMRKTVPLPNETEQNQNTQYSPTSSSLSPVALRVPWGLEVQHAQKENILWCEEGDLWSLDPVIVCLEVLGKWMRSKSYPAKLKVAWIHLNYLHPRYTVIRLSRSGVPGWDHSRGRRKAKGSKGGRWITRGSLNHSNFHCCQIIMPWNWKFCSRHNACCFLFIILYFSDCYYY